MAIGLRPEGLWYGRHGPHGFGLSSLKALLVLEKARLR